jgi:hypothetical protein
MVNWNLGYGGHIRKMKEREKKKVSVLILILSRILAFYGVEINYRHRMMQYIFLPRPMFNMRHLTRVKFFVGREDLATVSGYFWQIFIVQFDPFRCKGNLMLLNELPHPLFNLFSFQRQIHGLLFELRGFKGWVYSWSKKCNE